MIAPQYFTKYGFKLVEKKDDLDVFRFQNLNQNETTVVLTLFRGCDLTCEIVYEKADDKITPFKNILVLNESDIDFLITHCGYITNILSL